jgi:hypothetical protein
MKVIFFRVLFYMQEYRQNGKIRLLKNRKFFCFAMENMGKGNIFAKSSVRGRHAGSRI